jgi:hypothetical protein
VKTIVPQGAGAPDSRPHESVVTGLPALLLGSKNRRRYLGRTPIFDIGPQNAIRAAIGAAGGDALTNIVDLEAKGSTKLMKCYFLGGLRK